MILIAYKSAMKVSTERSLGPATKMAAVFRFKRLRQLRTICGSVKGWMDMDRRIDNIHSMIINVSHPRNDYQMPKNTIISSSHDSWATLYNESSDIKCLENKQPLNWEKDLHQADDSCALAGSNFFPVI